jgi:O-antigen/teichoic acid export membrane protein
MAGLFTTLAGLLLDGGLSVVLVSQRDLSVEQQEAAATAVLLISAFLAALIMAAAPLGSAYFNTAPLTRIIQVSAFYLPLSALTVVPLALQSREMRFRQIAVIQAASSLLQGICTLGLAYLGKGYWALIVGNFVGTGLRACLLWMTLKQSLVPHFRLGVLRPFLRNSGHLIGQRLTYFATADFDTFLLSRFAGASVLGPYSLAKSLSHSALDQISGIVTQISVPTFAAKPDIGSQLRGLVKVISLASTILFPLFWLMATLSRTLLPFLFGARWSAVVIPFCAFCLILPLRGVYALLESSVIGTGRTSTTFKNMLTWAVVMMPFLFIGVTMRFYGTAVYGAAIAWIVGFPLVFLTTMRRIARAFGTRVSVLLQPMWIPAACSLISCIAVEVVKLSLSPTFNALSQLGSQAFVGGVCYLITMRQFGGSHYRQFLELLMRLLRRQKAAD